MSKIVKMHPFDVDVFVHQLFLNKDFKKMVNGIKVCVAKKEEHAPPLPTIVK